MNSDFEIRSDWEKLEDGSLEDRACFAAVGFRYGNVWLSEAEDLLVHRVRGQAHLSAYRLAEWFAWNWWRLRWEPRTRAIDWPMAHHLTTIGGGYVWPNITVFSDGERVVLLARPTRSHPTEPVRYLANIAAVVLARDFEAAVDLHIEQVLGQLYEEQLRDTNLAAIWSNVRDERSNPETSARRKLEALLGFDPDGADDAEIEALIHDSVSMGRKAMDEVAAERPRHGRAITAATLRELANDLGFDSRPRDAVSLRPGTTLPPIGPIPAWLRGAETARQLRTQQALGASPISNARLAEMAAVDMAALGPDAGKTSVFSFALDLTKVRGRVALRSKWGTGRRFELARLIGDRLAGGVDGQLLPATHSYTYRQKFQRSFAAELLCPFAALDDFLQDDYSADAILGASEYFDVSPLTVRTLLVNHKRLEREDLEEDIDLTVVA